MERLRSPRPMAQQTVELLAQLIARVVHGSAPPTEVTTVLARVCRECADQPPEVLLLRVKDLWSKVASGSGVGFEEGDRRYLTFIGECLVTYYGYSTARTMRHPPLADMRPVRDADGCGEPEAISLR